METFNTYFSVIKFLKSVAAEFDLTVFLNKKLTPAEEQLIATLDRWLVVQIDYDATDVLQPLFVKLHLFATSAADPTTIWLHKTPQQFNHIVIQRKTHPDTSLNLIAIYDYDTDVGASALSTFQQTGTIPTALLTALQKEYPAVGLWEPCGQKTGLQVITTESPQLIDTTDAVYQASWRIIFRYFSPESAMGLFPNL